MNRSSFRLRATGSAFRRLSLALSLAFGLGGPAISSAQAALPALVDPPSQQHHTGKVVLVELVTPDLAAAKAFYGGLFGWTFKDTPIDNTAIFSEAYLGDQPVAGMVELRLNPGVQRQPNWLTFISTPDVDTSAAAALSNGAKQLLAPRDVPGRGKEAVLPIPRAQFSA